MGSNRNWEKEVREILRRKQSESPPSSGPGLLDRVGRFVIGRVANPRQMATTGAVLLCASLLLAIFPVMRLIVPLTAAVGVVMLFLSYLAVVGIRNRRTGRGRNKMWRGRAVDDRPEPGRLGRLFDRWRRG